MSKKIYMSGSHKDKYTIVDDEDYDLCLPYKWYLNKSGYVLKYETFNKKQVSISIHRFIMKLPIGNKLVIDHINRNPLDNRKENLRICTKLENARNTYTNNDKNFNSYFKGVSKVEKGHTTWQAHITVNKKTIHLGTFYNEKIAALAYDQAARKHHGEFACLNFPEINDYNSVNHNTRSPHFSSPYKGIVAKKFSNGKIKWMVYFNGKYLKLFDDLEEAHIYRTKYIEEQNNVN